MRYVTPVIALLLGVAACTGGEGQGDEMRMASGEASANRVFDSSGAPLGAVRLTHSCSDNAATQLGRGLALLHHMTYEEARDAFASATEVDPDCAMGYWGQAMTFVHPLWSDPPSEGEFERGRALLQEARERAETDRVSAYVDAVAGYYEAGQGDSERPNLVGFARGWRAYHEKYPNDPEGTAFYALAQLGTVDPSDKTFSVQRAAGAMAKSVLDQIPNHPGGHHYVIHAYDNPELKSKAVEVARSYGDIAPDVPHALHMPTHTFTRLGLWDESIEYNRRSADAALKHPVGEATSLHYFHALDYLAYAHLQKAQDDQALEVLAELEAVEPPYQPHVASAYAFAAIPARIALERHDWAAAADLEPREPEAYPWDNAPAMVAITYFARALGAARSGQFEQARQDLDVLADLEMRVSAASPYWGTQVEIQRLSAQAWLQFEQGSRDQGLETMRSAAQMEAETEKHPVTPGEVLPARELLADMLLELERPEDALAEYQAALERSPNRFNSLYGAGRAAEMAGDEAAATRYYEKLVEVTTDADTERERLKHARSYLAER